MEVSKNITEGTVDSVSEINEYKPGKRLLTFRLKTKDEYPTMLEFTIFNDKIDKHADKLSAGNDLKVQFNVVGREFNGRIYHSLSPWAIELLGADEVFSTLSKVAEQTADPDLDEDVPF